MKRPALIISIILFLISMTIISYKVIVLRYPILPVAPGQVWQFSFEAYISPEDNKIHVEFGLPLEHTGRMIIEERIFSGNLNFNTIQTKSNRFGVWTGDNINNTEYIFYRATIILRPRRMPKQIPNSIVANPQLPAIEKEEQGLAERIVKKWEQRLPRQEGFRAILYFVGEDNSFTLFDEKDRDVWRELEQKYGKTTGLLLLLNTANFPVRATEGLVLADEIKTTTERWLEVWTGERWEFVFPEKAEIIADQGRLLPLSTEGLPAVFISRGTISDVRWSLNKQIASKWRIHFERIQRSSHFLDRWSLFSLPVEFQNTFRILLLVPIGALLICILRNMVGFPTFGIFMPVLMALAFRSTGLIYGLGIFLIVVLIGYTTRRWLDRLRLLLVPRLSALLTLVIICFTIFALAGSRIGIRELLAVGLLPIVILTMTIERFFIVIEESGVGEAIKTAAGSAAVASITYFIIQWDPLQLIFFIYPELLFAVGAMEILIGRYTG
ncbi:MAG: UUP1 family membrane protein, partial [Syntrophorhabdaceae bacterium]|nr:UUP1 family membrane protein [Syntrophorhabdaceae bacterium]